MCTHATQSLCFEQFVHQYWNYRAAAATCSLSATDSDCVFPPCNLTCLNDDSEYVIQQLSGVCPKVCLVAEMLG